MESVEINSIFLSAFIVYISSGYVNCSSSKDLTDDSQNRFLPFEGLNMESSAIPETLIYKSPTSLAHQYSSGLTGVLLFIYISLNLIKAVLAMKCLQWLYHFHLLVAPQDFYLLEAIAGIEMNLKTIYYSFE